jgi:transcription elongation factor GreA
MANEPTYLTAEGMQRLQDELKHLTGPAREDLANRLRIAISQGDLSENAITSRPRKSRGSLKGVFRNSNRYSAMPSSSTK